jgi:hypothetical protein
VDIPIEGGFLHSFATDGDRVVVAHDKLDNDDNTLYIFRDASDIEKEVKLTGLGHAARITDAIGGKFYFGAALYNVEEGTYDNTLNYYSLQDDEIRTILHTEFRFELMAESNGYLFVLQDDRNSGVGNGIVVIDEATDKESTTYPLEFFPEQIEAHNGYLYLLGFYKQTGESCFVQYRIDGPHLTKVNENALDDELTKKGRERNTPYFASGMFFRD